MIESVQFKVVKDIAEAEKLWKMLSPNETIYDFWEFRYCFYKYFNFELFFYAGYEKDVLIGLLPLQYNSQEKQLEFFGGNYMEDNRVFVNPGFENYIPLFYKQISQPAKLECIRGTDSFTTQLPHFDFKFMLDLAGIQNADDYINKQFHSETRKKLAKRVRKLNEEGIEIRFNQFSDLETLFNYHIQDYGEHSGFVDRPFRKEIFRDLLKLKDVQPYLKTFVLNNEVHAVTLTLVFNDILESFSTAISPEALKNIREHVFIKKIDLALEKKLRYIDSFTGDYGWKEKWHSLKIPQYRFYWPEDKNLLEK